MRASPYREERSFGVSVGGVLVLIAIVLAWRGTIARAEVLAVLGSALVLAGLTYPRILKWPSAIWWRFARVLGHVNARVLLTVLFAIVFVPLSMFWRVTGKDPLYRRRGTSPGWLPYPPRYRDHHHYTRMY
jgi:hypothetical protein